MLAKNIKFLNFKDHKIQKSLKSKFKNLINKKSDTNNLISSFAKSYPYSYDKKQLKRVKPKVYTVIKGLESDGILKFGDLILKLSKYKINNLYDFCKAKNKLKWNSKKE